MSILLLALLSLGAPPTSSAELEVARGRAAWAEGDARAAFDHARRALRVDRDDWRAVQLWLESGDALGLAPMVEAQAWTMGRQGGAFRVAHVWTRVAGGDLPRQVLAEPAVREADPRLTLLAMGEQALDQGRPDLAVEVLQGHPDPHASALRLEALVREGRLLAATRFATESLHRHPAYPLSAIPLLDVNGPRATRRAQDEIRTTLRRRIAQIHDPVVLWRLREAAIQGGLHESAAHATIRLVDLGEPTRLDRRRLPRWHLELRAIRALDARDPVAAMGLASLTPSERRTVGQIWLDRADREGAATPQRVDRVLTAVRETADEATLATRHAEALVALNRAPQAALAAESAVRLATRPALDDLGRLDRGRQALEVAQALAVRGRIRLESGDALEAAVDLTVSSLLVADGEGPLRDRALRELQAVPEVKTGTSLEAEVEALDVALQEAVDAGDGELALRLALVRAPSRAQWRRRMAVAMTAAPTREADPVVRVVLPALVDPTGTRLLQVAEALDAIDEHDAAFVARAAADQLGAGPVRYGRSWRGLAGLEPAAEIVGRAWVEADARPPRGAVDGPTLGEPLPAAELSALDGPLDLRDLLGQVVLVVTWTPACGACRVAIEELDRMADEVRAQGRPVTVLAVGLVDDRETFRRAARAMERDRVVFAQVDPVAQRWLSPGERPMVLLIGADGLLRQRVVGWNGEHRRTIEASIDAFAAGMDP